MKRILFIVFASFLLFQISAQVVETEPTLKPTSNIDDMPDDWRYGGVTNLNFSQVHFSNWAAGGVSSYSLNGLVSLFATKKQGLWLWENTLDMGYGFLNEKNEDEYSYRKTDDKFDLTSKLGYKAFSSFYYTAMLNFKTQFSKGYDYDLETRPKISNFLSPAYLTAALGLTYQPNVYFSAFLAPVTGRLTIVNDQDLADEGAFGVDPGKNTRMEFGGYLRTVFSKNDFTAPVLKNITITSKLDLFSNYLEQPENIDVNWELLVALRVNKFISVNISTTLIYDNDTKILNKDGVTSSPKVQFKELLGVGFSYNF